MKTCRSSRGLQCHSPAPIADQGESLDLQASQIFLCYLAGVPTTVLAAQHAMPAPRINRYIKRTTRHLLAIAGSAFEKNRPLVHLSRLRNETSLWLFRLAIALPCDAARSLAATEMTPGDWNNADEQVRLHAQLRNQFRVYVHCGCAPENESNHAHAH